jgi:hypothetical protein
MNILTAQKVNNEQGNYECIKANIDNVIKFIPLDEGNIDYQAIQEWVAAGNTIQEAD